MSNHTHWKRWAGAVSGTALGYIGAGIPGAVAGARMGYSAGKKRDYAESNLPENSTTMATPRSVRRRLSFSTPRSVRSRTGSSLFATPSSGRFSRIGSYLRRRGSRRSYRVRKCKSRYRKPKRSFGKKKYRRKYRKMKKPTSNMAKLKGYEVKLETYGEVSDAHCVYIKHSTQYIVALTQAILTAMVRKVFEKAGYQIGNYDQVLTAEGPAVANAAPYRLLFTYVDPVSGAAVDYAYSLAAGEKLSTINTNWTQPRDLLRSYFLNGIQVEIVSISLQILDTHPTTDKYTTKAVFNVENEVMNLFVTSELRVQNRTQSASGSTSTDVVDTQPLYGKMFTYRNADPRTQFSSTTPGAATADILVNGISKLGLDLLPASNLPFEYYEPPTKNKFINCTSVSKVTLGVGETKQFGFKWNLVGKTKNVLKKLRPVRGTTDSSNLKRTYGASGKCQMLCLEEMIRTGDTHPIKIGYEREYTVGCYFVTKKKNAIASDFGTENKNGPFYE